MRVVLVGADFEENLGVGMIAAVAEAAGHRVAIAPFNSAAMMRRASPQRRRDGARRGRAQHAVPAPRPRVPRARARAARARLSRPHHVRRAVPDAGVPRSARSRTTASTASCSTTANDDFVELLDRAREGTPAYDVPGLAFVGGRRRVAPHRGPRALLERPRHAAVPEALPPPLATRRRPVHPASWAPRLLGQRAATARSPRSTATRARTAAARRSVCAARERRRRDGACSGTPRAARGLLLPRRQLPAAPTRRLARARARDPRATRRARRRHASGIIGKCRPTA